MEPKYIPFYGAIYSYLAFECLCFLLIILAYSRQRENLSNMRERERKHRHALVAAKKNRELAMKYLKETMSRYVLKNINTHTRTHI